MDCFLTGKPTDLLQKISMEKSKKREDPQPLSLTAFLYLSRARVSQAFCVGLRSAKAKTVTSLLLGCGQPRGEAGDDYNQA